MPTPAEFADRWKITVQRVCALRDAGMPIDSWEAAESWRAKQKGSVAQMRNTALRQAVEGATPGEAGLPAEGFDALLDPSDYIEQIKTQRIIVGINRAEYLRALRDPARTKEAAKIYGAFNKATTQLFQTRDKALAHGLATKQLINSQTVLEAVRRAFALMVSKYETGEVAMAQEANPADPAKALAVIRAGRLKIQREIYETAQAAARSLTGKDALPSLEEAMQGIAKANEAGIGDDEGVDMDNDQSQAADPFTPTE